MTPTSAFPDCAESSALSAAAGFAAFSAAAASSVPKTDAQPTKTMPSTHNEMPSQWKGSIWRLRKRMDRSAEKTIRAPRSVCHTLAEMHKRPIKLSPEDRRSRIAGSDTATKSERSFDISGFFCGSASAIAESPSSGSDLSPGDANGLSPKLPRGVSTLSALYFAALRDETPTSPDFLLSLSSDFSASSFFARLFALYVSTQ